MKEINIYISKTDKLLFNYKEKLKLRLQDCRNDLDSYEVRIEILKCERKEYKFNKIKLRLLDKYNAKDSATLKRIYKTIKKRNLRL